MHPDAGHGVIARAEGPWQSPGKVYRFLCILCRQAVPGDSHVGLSPSSE